MAAVALVVAASLATVVGVNGAAGAQPATPSGTTAAGAAVSVTLDWATPIVDRANVSMTSPVVVPNGSNPFVVTGDEGGNLRAFYLSSGAPVPGWSSVNAGFRLRAPLSTDGTNVYVPVAQDGIDRYPSFKKYSANGALLWNSNPATSYGSTGQFLLGGMSLAQIGGQWKGFGPSSGHWVYRVDGGSGKQEWAFRNADSTMATPAIADVLGLGTPQIITSNDKSPEFSTDKAGGHLRIFTAGGAQICSADQLANGLTYQSSGYNNSSPAVAQVSGHPLIVFGSTGPVQTGAGGNQILGYDATCRLRWASPPLAAQANPSPTFADVTGDGIPEVITIVGIDDGGLWYPRVYVLNANTGAILRDTGTSLRPYGAGGVRYTQASSVVTADVNADGVQDLFVPAARLLVLNGSTMGLLANLDMGGVIQNSPVITAEAGGGVRATIAGYSANNGHGVSGGIARSWVFPNGTLGAVGWPRFGHDSQLTGLQGALNGPYDQLIEGQQLASGQRIRSRANGYTATMQADGNFVLRRADGLIVWQTRTNAPGAHLEITSAGNTRVVSPTGVVLWQAYATGTGVERLVIGTDGHLRATSGTWVGSERTNSDRLLWTTNRDLNAKIPRDHLYQGTYLPAGQSLRSPNGVYRLEMGRDGRVVLYRGTTARWATSTGVRDTARLVMQVDGNVVVTSPSRVVKSFGVAGRGGLFLRLSDNGMLQVVTSTGGVVWQVSGA